MGRVLDQCLDMPDPMRMSARKLAELNDRILVHKQGQCVQLLFCGSCFQSKEKRCARLRGSRFDKHDCRQIPHCDLPICMERVNLKWLDPRGDGDPQRFISRKKPKWDKLRLQRIFASGGQQEVRLQTVRDPAPTLDFD